MRLIFLSLAWVAGIYIGSLVSPPLYALLLALILSLTIALLWRKRQAFLWGGLCLIAFLSGIGYYQCRISEPTLQSFNNQGIVELRGKVDRDPQFEGETSRLSLSAQEIKADSQWEEVSGKVLIYTRVFPAYSQGDSLKVTGELRSLSQIENPGYRAYLSQQGFCSLISYPEMEFIQRGWLFSVRNRLSQSLSSALPEPQGSLAQALLLGIRSHIPDSLRDNFRSSGTAHLIAISGLHVAILGGIVLSIGAWLFGRRRPTYILIAFGMVWMYAMLTGMSPPAFRAAIMISLFLAALWLGRPRSAMPSLALAGAIMVGINPGVLWDVSFQLSFVAVAGLILLVPPLHTLVRKTSPGEGVIASTTNPIIESFLVTLAAIIATLPLIAYYFGYVSLVALPATFLALLALPGVIVITLLTAILGLLAPALAWVTGWVDWLFLSYIIKVVEGFSALPFASYQVSPINGAAVWAYYGVLLVILFRRRLGMAISKPVALGQKGLSKLQFVPRLPKRWALLFLLIMACLVWLMVIVTPDRQLEVSFLNVGQGEAILIQTPNRQQILIDGGPDPEAISLCLGKELPFWDRSLDLVVLTHAEDDHLVGLVEVLQRYKVGQVLKPGFEQDTIAYEEWLRLIEEKEIELTIAQAGQQIDLGGGVRIEVLHPQEEPLKGTNSDVNNNSVVLRLVWDEVSFLLTGDIYEEAEREILHQGGRLNSTVLKVAHHGGDSSTSPHFLAAVDPEVAVICVGADNPFGHPAKETLDRLEEKVGEHQVYLTSERGTITFTTDGRSLWVETER